MQFSIRPSAGSGLLAKLLGNGSLLAGVAVLLLSVRPVLVKLCYAYSVDAVTLLTLRMGLALPAFVAVALWLRRRAAPEPIRRSDWYLIALLGFVGYYLASYLDFLGLQYIPAGLGRLILFVYPTVVVIMSWGFLRRPAGARQIVALGVTYAGLALVLGETARIHDQAHLLLGSVLVFASAVSYSIYLVIGSQVVQRVGALRFTAYATIVASGLCIIQFALMRPWSALAVPSAVWAYSALMAIGCTVIPLFLTAEALRRVGANQVAIIGALGPVTTIAFGAVGLDERLGWIQLLGSAIVLAGVLLVTTGNRQR